MTEPAISIEQISLSFPVLRYHARGVKEALLGWAAGRRYSAAEKQFWALRDLSLEIGRGEVIGLVGRNGSGKSTLLKIISGIYRPDSGRVRTRGRISSLIELGAGFKEELTGYENIRLNGAILGFSPEDMAKRAGEIIAFAELEQFIHQPLRTYSSGMKVRLGFAVATSIEPEILLVDEVLAVGDEAFRRRSMARIEQMARGDTTILVVSHDLTTMQKLCRRLALLSRGSLVTEGAPDAVLEAYHRLLEGDAPAAAADGAALQIRGLGLRDAKEARAEELECGAPAALELEIEVLRSPPAAFELRFSLKRDALLVADWSTRGGAALPELPAPGGRLRCRFALAELALAPGHYQLHAAVFDASGIEKPIASQAQALRIVDPRGTRAGHEGLWVPRGEWSFG